MTGNVPYPTLLDQWLHGRPATTVRKYRAVVTAFLAECADPANIAVSDVQGYLNRRSHLAPSSRNAALAAIKSFLRYAHDTGVVPRDVGRLVRSERQRDRLAERIIGRDDVLRMITGEDDLRNRALLMLLYYGGLRVSEAVNLTWSDIVPRAQSYMLVVYGKGGKVRALGLPPVVRDALSAIRERERASERVFSLSVRQAERIVKAAAVEAGLSPKVSCHWLRHCHASHALDAGAPIHLVRDTLGHSSISTTSRYLHANPRDSSANYLDR